LISIACLSMNGALAAPSGRIAPDAHQPAAAEADGLHRFHRANFLTDRRRFEAALATDAADRPAASLAMAEFLLAHALVPEGRSVLEPLTDDLSPTQTRRKTELELAFRALSVTQEPLDQKALSALSQTMPEWPDLPVFRLLHLERQAAFAEAARDLPAALGRADLLSKPLQAAILPAMLHVAVETAQWAEARELAEFFAQNPDLARAPAYHYLLGRTAAAAGDLLAAYDNYLKAGGGTDLWAHRARMALVELGLKNRLISKAEALPMIQQESRTWRGDDHEVDTIHRVAALQLKLDDPVAALETLSMIATRFPGTDHAALSRQQARSLWAEFYAKAADMPLAELLAGHHRIAMDYRFEPGFSEGTEALADRFMAAGATMVAADEYRETHDYLLVGRDLGLVEADNQTLDRLRLKQADAFLAGGQVEEAAHILSEEMLSDNAELHDWLNMSRARLSAIHGNPDGVIDTAQSTPSLQFQRLRAAALYERGDWAAAQAAYAAVLDRADGEAEFVDVMRLLLSAHHAGDAPAAHAVIQQFPALATRPEWQRIAAGMTDAPPPVLPLRAETADARINFVAETLAVLDALAKPSAPQEEQSDQ
jgi:hypothetical protein